MGLRASVLIIIIALTFSACTRRNNERVGREARKAEQASQKVAHQLGKAAYKAAEETGKVAQKAAHQIDKASHDAHQGWEEEKQKEKAKQSR
jgi:hypothetical protein